jgi:riboflavin biosynthesis pyrimidine reductase
MKIQLIKSPKIFGDDALGFVSDLRLDEIHEAKFRLISQKSLGEDHLLIYRNKDTDQFAAELEDIV